MSGRSRLVRTAIAVWPSDSLWKFDLFLELAHRRWPAARCRCRVRHSATSPGGAHLLGTAMVVLAAVRFLITAKQIDSPSQVAGPGARIDWRSRFGWRCSLALLVSPDPRAGRDAVKPPRSSTPWAAAPCGRRQIPRLPGPCFSARRGPLPVVVIFTRVHPEHSRSIKPALIMCGRDFRHERCRPSDRRELHAQQDRLVAPSHSRHSRVSARL